MGTRNRCELVTASRKIWFDHLKLRTGDQRIFKRGKYSSWICCSRTTSLIVHTWRKLTEELPKFPTIYQNFNHQWHPAEKHLTTLSVAAWWSLPLEEKQRCSLQKCKARNTKYQTLSSVFPYKSVIKRSPSFPSKVLTFLTQALTEINAVTKEVWKANSRSSDWNPQSTHVRNLQAMSRRLKGSG